MIKFSCSQCGRNYEVEEKYSGKSVRCKKCNNKITIPNIDQINNLTKGYELADEDFVTQSQSDNSESHIELDNDTKPCPFCGEEILEIAKKCKHCGEYLEDTKSVLKKQVSPKSKIPVITGIIILIIILSGATYFLLSSGNDKPNTNNQSSKVAEDKQSEDIPEYIGEFEKVITSLRRLENNVTAGNINYSEYKKLVSSYIDSFSDLGVWLDTGSVPEDMRVKDLLTNLNSSLGNYNNAVSHWGKMIENVDSGYLTVEYEKSRDRSLDFAMYEGQMSMAIFKSLKNNEPIEDYKVLRKSMLKTYNEMIAKYKKEADEQVDRWNKTNPNMQIK